MALWFNGNTQILIGVGARKKPKRSSLLKGSAFNGNFIADLLNGRREQILNLHRFQTLTALILPIHEGNQLVQEAGSV